MKLNLVPLVKFFEKVTVLKLFSVLILIPSALVLITIATSQHKGTRYAVTDEVEFDVSVGGVPKGTITMGLFGDDVPKTVHNFITFATNGYKGYKYEGTYFHRVIPKFMVQGGDVTATGKGGDQKAGTGGVSVYGGKGFADESFKVAHAGPGFIGMANTGPNTNGCQFYITTSYTGHLDNFNVLFGKVVKNQGVVHLIENLDRDTKDRPLEPVVVTATRHRKPSRVYTVSDDPYNIWDWIMTISLPLTISFVIVNTFSYFMKYIDRGIAIEDELIKQARTEGMKTALDGPSDGKESSARKRNVSKSESEDVQKTEGGREHLLADIRKRKNN